MRKIEATIPKTRVDGATIYKQNKVPLQKGKKTKASLNQKYPTNTLISVG